jgi:DNA helicase-2/ATP-dependent DNA helicase PcrA
MYSRRDRLMTALAAAIRDLRENPRQWDAFTTVGDCVVLAPPGSGKTKLLTTRVAHDLVTGAIPPPQGAACLTMTNEAVGELRRRLSDLGAPFRANLFVGTVHAFALGCVVRPYAEAAGRGPLAEARLARTSEIDDAFEEAFNAVLGAGANPVGVEETMNRVRRLGDYSGSRFLGGPDIAALARAYEANLEREGLYDFNDLMRHALDMLSENEWLRRVLVSTYPHLYIDEYQDLPPTLDALVRMFCFDQAVDATLFAVGDPDQAIYGFMGTRPQLLTELAEISGVTKVELEVNYRCGQAIIDASLAALGETRVVRGISEGGEIVVHAPADGDEAQHALAVDLVMQAHAEGVPYEQITVLSYANFERDLVAEALRSAGIPTYARSDVNYRTTPVTMAIEALASYASSEPPEPTELADVVDAWNFALPERIDHEQQTELVRLLIDTPAEHDAGTFVEALATVGLESTFEDDSESLDAREVQRMREALGAAGSLADMTVAQLGDRARARGCVMAATTHGVKGLEFDVVIILDAEEGRLPNWRTIKSGDRAAIEEDRRKFYVGLTRARKRVHVASAGWRISRAGNRYTVDVSRFVRPFLP